MGHHPFLEEKLTENNKIATTNDHEGDGERVIHAIHQAQGSLSPLQQRGGGWVRRSSGLCSRGAQCWAAVGPAPATLTGPFTFRLRSCGFLGPGGLSSIHIRVPCWCICESITDKQWRRGGGRGRHTHAHRVWLGPGGGCLPPRWWEQTVTVFFTDQHLGLRVRLGNSTSLFCKEAITVSPVFGFCSGSWHHGAVIRLVMIAEGICRGVF